VTDVVTDIERVGVVGCGQMGSGIAEVCARAGLDVRVAETTGEALEIGRTRLFNSLAKAVERGKITEEEREATQARLHFTTDLGEFADRDLVIEAVVENEQVKTEIFQVLDQVVTRPDAILASNTSSIPIMKLGVVTSRPNQVIGIHFFNPAPVQKLVELIPALTTSENTLNRAQLFAEKVLGKMQQEHSLSAMGVECVSLFITSIKPTPEMAKALEAEYREALQKRADQAIFSRRADAVEQERKIKQNELSTAVDLEERRRELVELQSENARRQAEVEAETTRVMLEPYQDIDKQLMLALAFRDFANNASKIGNLTITSEILERLLRDKQ